MMKSVLDKFCRSSGHKINAQKTQIFYSINVPHEMKDNISYGIGFSHVDNLGKYLGVPLLHQRVTK